MIISDEQIMAYVDGELDARARAYIDRLSRLTPRSRDASPDSVRCATSCVRLSTMY